MAADKFQRWVDLVTTLLHFRAGLTFDDLAREVPGYRDARDRDADDTVRQSVKRAFERDKAEIKALGIPIDTIGDDGEEDTRYRIRPTDFYLPYLALATPRGVEHPDRVARYGYRELATLTFGPDELLAIAEGASRARQLGDPALTADVDSAMRKLAFDLPLDAGLGADEAHIVPPRAAADPATLRALTDALLARKRVRLVYRAMSSDEASERVVEPWGLFSANAHWYLAAFDLERRALRNFRVSRIGSVTRENGRTATPDYEIPATFHLREHARVKQPWELGDGDAMEAVVEFRGETGAVVAAAALGAPVPGAPDRRTFTVRRADAFARWVLSFAGAAVPLSPPSVVEEFRSQAARTAALYAGDAPGGEGGA